MLYFFNVYYNHFFAETCDSHINSCYLALLVKTIDPACVDAESPCLA